MSDTEKEKLVLTLEEKRAEVAALLKALDETMPPKRISQTSIARGEYPQAFALPGEVVTVPMWVKLLIASCIPMLGGAATMLPPPWNAVVGIVGLGVGGVAAWLGMSVGAPKK